MSIDKQRVIKIDEGWVYKEGDQEITDLKETSGNSGSIYIDPRQGSTSAIGLTRQ